MPPTHTVLFTVLPRGLAVNPATLPVSVLVSPRLTGADRLGAFPDWLEWTATLQRGLSLTLLCGTARHEVHIDTEPLRPQLWSALFTRDTFVRSRTFDDYSQHGVLSYSVRESLSALKAVYQEASVALALPDEGPESPQGERQSNRRHLAAMLDGLDVHWNATDAPRWREVVRHRVRAGNASRAINGPLDGEGLISAPRNPGAFQGVAVPFAVYHHMPTPTEEQAGAVKFDPDQVDFHQALSALESHPALLRALGLVFDLELPRDFVPQTAFPAFSTVSVIDTSIGWQLAPGLRPLQTACVHTAAGSTRLFFTATRAQGGAGSSPAQVLGLLNLDAAHYGVAQVDVDGAMHKVMTVAEIANRADPGRNLYDSGPEEAPNPEVIEQDATLPSMRSSGLQLYVDRRGAAVLDAIAQSKAFNDAVDAGGAQPRPFFAEDLIRGYRLDIWESRTSAWHSLHRRSGQYAIGDEEAPFATDEEEGFFELATTQPAPGAEPADKDLYVHEVIARWAGWSLSVPFPAKSLTHHGDPELAVPPSPPQGTYETDEAITAFKIRARYSVIKGSLPRLRFGSRYRVRARAVDLAGNSLAWNDPLADGLARVMALPRDNEGLACLRYDPVPAPLVIIRDERALTSPGSAAHRLVIRTSNASQADDGIAADATAGDRHIVPPRTSAEMGERLGMFDDAAGKLKADPATWQLIADRDAGQFNEAAITVAGRLLDKIPIEPADQIAALPHLPDPFSRGAALRNLPGSGTPTIGRVEPGAGAAGAVTYTSLSDINPRPGSATLVSFNAGNGWLQTLGFRLALAEPPAGGVDSPPHWDPAARVLTVYLAKGRTAVVPLSSYLTNADLALMGQWQWMREFVDAATVFFASPAKLRPGQPVDTIAHVLQRTVEGGHWMLTPPTVLTLVHAVQQPLGRPAFAALNVDHEVPRWPEPVPLQTGRMRGRTDSEELTPVTAWRRPGATSALLMGAIHVHGASTAKVELSAAWVDPVDDVDEPGPGVREFRGPVDELPLPRPREGYLLAKSTDGRRVGYYDPEHDQIAMVRTGDRAAKAASVDLTFADAAPKHEIGDTRRHLVRYTAIASSRYREYFPADPALDFTRTSEPVLVDVPASARPLAPDIVYIVPTFGWQRQTDTNLKRSVRFGGGLRVYLRRPWYSSGEGELLGVALWSGLNGTLDNAARDKFKPFFTQWGMDPIWKTAGLYFAPGTYSFPDAVSEDYGVSLEEPTASVAGNPGRADVVGYAPAYDAERGLWFADITVDAGPTYSPFVRLALVRYQPHALDDARISRVVLADFAQLTPDRTATVTADPHHPRTLRVAVSGVAPTAPLPSGAGVKPARPTHVQVRVQKRNSLGGELGWEDAPAADATVTQAYEGAAINGPDLALWVGAVTFTQAPAADTYRLLVEEFEYISADYVEGRNAPGRLIYAETFEVDAGLAGG